MAELAEVDKNEVVQAKDRENPKGLAKLRVPPQILRIVPSRRTSVCGAHEEQSTV